MSQAADPTSLPKDHLAHPNQWATGGDPATSKQKGFIKVLEKQHPEAAPEGGIEVEGMQKGEASEVIEKLKSGEAVEPSAAEGNAEEKVGGLVGNIQDIIGENEVETKDEDVNEKDIGKDNTKSPAKPSQSSSQKGRRITSDSQGEKPASDPTSTFSDLVSQHETKKADASAMPTSSSQAPPPSSQSEQVDFSGVDRKATKQTTLDGLVEPQSQENGTSSKTDENGTENGVAQSGENGHKEDGPINGENGHATENGANGATEQGSKSARKRKDEEAAPEEAGATKKAKVVGKGVKEAIDEIVADDKW